MALDSLLVLTTPHLDAVRPLLACMASNIFHAGPIGAGQVVKLANNNLIYIHQLALSLSLLSGSKHGVPPALLSAIINTSTGRSFMSTNWNPDPDSVPGSSAPAKNGYVIPPGFPVFGAVKDISLGKEMGELVGVENPLVRETLKVFEAASRSGEHKGLDFSSVYRWLADNLSRI
jgi:3-hydroxyisobutyrate dehydrogenase